MGRPFAVEIEVELSEPLSVILGVGFNSKSGARVLTTNTDYSELPPFMLASGVHTIACTFSNLSLAPGEYVLSVGCTSEGFVLYDEIREACLIDVLPPKDAPPYFLHKFSTCMTKAMWTDASSMNG